MGTNVVVTANVRANVRTNVVGTNVVGTNVVGTANVVGTNVRARADRQKESKAFNLPATLLNLF